MFLLIDNSFQVDNSKKQYSTQLVWHGIGRISGKQTTKGWEWGQDME